MKRVRSRAVPTRALSACLLLSLGLVGCDNNDSNSLPPAPDISFDAVPSQVEAGGAIPLVWSAYDADTCTASGGTNSEWSGPVPITGYRILTAPDVSGTYTYSLSCENEGQTSSDSVSVQVIAVSGDVSLSLTPSLQTIEAGTTAIPLQWSAAGADSCTASGTDAAWAGARGTSGSFSPSPATAGVYIYNLRCSTATGDSASASAVVNVTQTGPAVQMTFSERRIAEGETSTLSWTVEGATGCEASGDDPAWLGTTPSASGGSFVVQNLAAGGYTYGLTCTDAQGDTSAAATSLSVANAPAPTIDGFMVTGTDPAVITWSATGATDCHAYSPTVPAWNGPRETSGSEEIPLADTTLADGEDYSFALICNGPGGQTWATTAAPAVESATASVSLLASPTRVNPGSPITLTWSSANASICSATGDAPTGWAGTKATSGQVQVNAPSETGIYAYSVACVDASLEVPAEATVYVTVGNATPTVNLLVNAAKTAAVNAGEGLTLSWTSTYALTCTADGGVPGRGWPGEQPLQSDGLFVDSTGLAGHYDFTLRCGVPGGQSAVETVGADVAGDLDQCGVGVPSLLLTGHDVEIPWARTSSVAVKIRSSVGETPIGVISAGDGSEVIDSDLESFTQLLLPLDLLGIGNIVVDVYSTDQNPDGTIKPLPIKLGQQAGFIVSNPNQWLSLSLLGLDSMSVITGVDADGNVTLGDADYSNADGLLLTALQLVNDSQRFFVSIPLDDATTEAGIYGIRYKMKGGLLAVAKMLNVYGACFTDE